MTAARKTRRDEMLLRDRRKLVILIKAQVELWGCEPYLNTDYGFSAQFSTIAGKTTIIVDDQDASIYGRFLEPERATKAGITMADSYNGKWSIHFGRESADTAAQRFVDAFSGFVGEPADWTLPPVVQEFTSKPLPPRDPNYVSPFDGDVVELCSNCLKNFSRPRDCSSDLCLRCAWAAVEYEREVATEAISNEETARDEITELEKTAKEAVAEIERVATEIRGRHRDAAEDLFRIAKDLKP